jgi:hypothetical protein
MFLVRYELGFHIPEDRINVIHRRENLRCYIIYCPYLCIKARCNIFTRSNILIAFLNSGGVINIYLHFFPLHMRSLAMTRSPT